MISDDSKNDSRSIGQPPVADAHAPLRVQRLAGGTRLSLCNDPHRPSMEVSDTVIDVWKRIETALIPIIGQKGFGMLYKRTLSLILPAHPWLAELHKSDVADLDFSALRSLLLHQSVTATTSCSEDLLETFETLLGSLIGTSLTNRLLSPLRARSPSALSQEPSP